MNYYLSIDDSGNAIMHHGVKGMKWGQHIFGDEKYKKKFTKYNNALSAISPNDPRAGKKANKIRKKMDNLNYKEYRKFNKYGGDNSDMSDAEKESVLRGGHSKPVKAAVIGTVLAGPVIGIAAGGVSYYRYNKVRASIEKASLGESAGRALGQALNDARNSNFYKSLASEIERNPESFGYTKEEVDRAKR